MLSYKVNGAGLTGLAVASLCKDIATGLTATGTIQTDALEVTTAKATFSTVASGTGAILSSLASAGDDQTIFNGGANFLKVYPPSGAKINNLPTNVGVILTVNTGVQLHCMSTTQWFGVLSA